MSAQNIVIVSKDTTDLATGTSPVNRLLSVTEVDTNFINLKQGIMDLESVTAPLNSPNLTGSATYNAAIAITDDSIQIANTAFVQDVLVPINAVINSSQVGNSVLYNLVTGKAQISGGNVFSGSQLFTGLPSYASMRSNTDAAVTSGWTAYFMGNLNVDLIPATSLSYNLGTQNRAWNELHVNSILPNGANSTIGTPSNPFSEGYFAANTIFVGDAPLSQGAAGGIVLPSGSAFGDEDSVVPRNLISTELDKIYGSQTNQTEKLVVTLVASGSVTTRDPLTLNSNGTVSAISTDNTAFIGIADSTATNGNNVSVVLSGEITGYTGLTSGSEVYVEADGTLRFDRGLSSDIKIGIATSSSSLFLYSTTTLDLYALSKVKAGLSDFSVTTAAPGANGLTYNSSTGEFTFTPVNLTTYATQSYVDTEIANLVDSAPTSLDTLNELAAALNDDANFATTVTNSLGTKAPLADPALTGTPTAPTASSGTNTTQIATTAFVQTAVANDIELTDLSVSTAAASSGGALSYDNATGQFTFTPADLSNAGNASLNSFSVTTGSANSNGGLSYNNTTGVFTFTPADLSGYLTSYTETDPVVGAINGIVKADGSGNISAAVAGTDYSTFDAAFSSLTGTPTTLSGYGITDAAPLASPTFTGTPAAPTATTGDSSTQLATTAFVQGEIAGFSTTGGDSQKSYTSSTAITEGDAVVLDTAGTVSSVGLSAAAVGSVSTFQSSIANQTSIGYDDYNSLYYYFFRSGSEIKVDIITPDFANLTTTTGSETTLAQNVSAGAIVKYVHLTGTSQGILVYYTSTGYQLRVVSQASGVWTANTATTVSSGDTVRDITLGPNNTPLLLIEDYSGYIQVAALSISGTNITIGTYEQITGFTSVPSDIFYVQNKIVVADPYGSTVEYATGTISGTTISMNTALSVNTANIYNNIYYHGGSGLFVLDRARGFGDINPQVEIHIKPLSFNGTTLTALNDIATGWVSGRDLTSRHWQFSSSGTGLAIYAVYQTYQSYSLKHGLGTLTSAGTFTRNSGYTGFGTGTSEGTNPGAHESKDGYGMFLMAGTSGALVRLDSVSNADSWLGVADSTVTSGNSVNVILAGGIADVYTGLILNGDYYVQDDGSIASTVTDVFAGVAVGSTALQITDSKNTFRKSTAFADLTSTPTTLSGYGISGDIDIGSSDFITTGKAYYSNLFSATGDLPSASTYHGMFAHVHATGKGYFAHAGNWVELANASTTLAGYGITDGATISYVDTEIANLINSAPGALDTLDELAAALGDDANFSSTVTNSLALKAPLADPSLTGTPTAPTATSGTNTTQIATTAFVQAAVSGLGGGGASVTVSDAAPSSPSAGDLWFDSTGLVLYVYYNDGDSSQWVQTNPSGSGSSGGSSGGASVSVSGTAPTSPSAGDLWFDDDDLFLYVYVNDGSSSQWVKTNPSGGSSSTWAEKTAAYTAEAGDKLIVDTSTAVTVTLPATAALGDEIRIIDGTGTASTNNITVGRNGHNIEGTAADLTIDVDRAAFGLVYYNATQGWIMMER